MRPARTGALLLIAGLPAMGGCGGDGGSEPPPAGAVRGEAPVLQPRPDIHSWARPDQVRVAHMELDWRVLFDEQALEGSALLRLTRAAGAEAEPLRLDTRDLEIRRVAAGRAGPDGPAGEELRDAPWRLGQRDIHLGAELSIDLPPRADLVRIDYRTSPEASGLQWLSAEQTAGGRHPFLYSQSQAIHARSWIPCQDTPGARVTYDALVRVPPPLRAAMAASRSGDGPEGFAFAMPYPIPPYLIALAVGDLSFGEAGPRTGVWSEPPLREAAVREFGDMERMLRATERIYGPYRWGRYDVLVLPPSFPFGGMENPMLTFATPTVLAGDRSLVSLVAHEMAHSWSGNLVTNATWSDFWLNEGFTTYIERRIMEEVYGRERAEMEWMLGRQDLEAELANLADRPDDQKLRIDLAGRDPDDAANDIPYQKGALLLRLIEESYGREAFDPFLRSWFDEHAFSSVTTDRFLAFLEERLLKPRRPLEGRVAPEPTAWIDRPGLPDDAPRARSGALEAVAERARLWSEGRLPARRIDTEGWSFHHWLHFLRSLPDDLELARMAELDAAFGFTRTGNSEILDQWLVLAVRHDYRPAFDRLERFLAGQGRRKFLTPIYKELMKTQAGGARAREIYARARPFYHAIARRTLDEIVGFTAPSSSPASP